jgi:hypothetical protein
MPRLLPGRFVGWNLAKTINPEPKIRRLIESKLQEENQLI